MMDLAYFKRNQLAIVLISKKYYGPKNQGHLHVIQPISTHITYYMTAIFIVLSNVQNLTIISDKMNYWLQYQTDMCQLNFNAKTNRVNFFKCFCIFLKKTCKKYFQQEIV